MLSIVIRQDFTLLLAQPSGQLFLFLFKEFFPLPRLWDKAEVFFFFFFPPLKVQTASQRESSNKYHQSFKNIIAYVNQQWSLGTAEPAPSIFGLVGYSLMFYLESFDHEVFTFNFSLCFFLVLVLGFFVRLFFRLASLSCDFLRIVQKLMYYWGALLCDLTDVSHLAIGFEVSQTKFMISG